MPEADFCILGAGIMGCATAYHLGKTIRNRQKIILVDQYRVGNDYGSSNDYNRVFRYAYGRDTYYTKLAVESRRLWQDTERESGQQLLVPSGLLLIQGSSPEWNQFNQESYETIRKLGYKAEELDRSRLERRHPQFQAKGAYEDPYAGVLLAGKALRTFSDHAWKNGVQILENMKATRIDSSSGSPVIHFSSGETIQTKKLLVTVGSWTNELISGKALTPVTPTRQQILYFQPVNPRIYRADKFPIFFVDEYYGIPAAGTDLVKISHIGRDEVVESAEVAKRSVDDQEIHSSREILKRYIPDLAESTLGASKVCVYDMTRDRDFVIGSDPENENIFYGYGFSGHGFKFAPLIGRTLSNILLGVEPGIDLERLKPTRQQAVPPGLGT